MPDRRLMLNSRYFRFDSTDKPIPPRNDTDEAFVGGTPNFVVATLAIAFLRQDERESAQGGRLQSCRRETMKLAPHAVDVSEGQHARVGSVCQQDVNAFSRGINPTTSAGKTCMAKGVRRQS